MKIQAKLFTCMLFIATTILGVTLAQTLPLPSQQSDTLPYTNPAIREFGRVVKLPNSAQQPRDGSKIVVDITKGGSPEKLNSAIEKVCRFVNIYAGAGRTPASASIAVVLHGDATLAVLNSAAYTTRFKTQTNPNLKCLEELTSAGVKVFVCGQSLIGKGAKPSDVHEDADVAVSALTTMVNLQADGYSYVPLLK